MTVFTIVFDDAQSVKGADFIFSTRLKNPNIAAPHGSHGTIYTLREGCLPNKLASYLMEAQAVVTVE